MNYDRELLNKLQLYNTTHDKKANEVILGVQCYRFIKNRVKHMGNWNPVFDDRGILREILGMTIKIDYMIPYIIEIRHNPYLKSSVDFIWLNEEEMKKEVDDELSKMIDNDLKDLHSFLEFEKYYEDRNNKEE